jgi:signal transduction histidine kinase
MRAGSDSGITASVLLAFALLLICGAAPAAPAAEKHYRVLVLHSYRHSLPVNTDWYRGIVRGFESAPDLRILFDIEALDLVQLSDSDYIADLLEIYRRKYAGSLPDLLIPTYTPAFKFLLDHGNDLFPGVPVVFCSVDTEFVSTRKMPSHVTGVTSAPDFAGTIQLALRLQPDARRMAVIVGAHALDKIFEDRARQALQSFEDGVEFTWLQGMPLEELLAAVQGLPRDMPILYVLELADRTGKSQFPFYTTGRLAGVANAPVYGLWDTLIGNGVIGGHLITIEDDGFQAGQMGVRVLRGEAPSAIPIVLRKANPAVVDGRELIRWNIDENRLPAGTQIRHRRYSVWELHQTEIIGVFVIIIVQAFLIVALLLHRRRLRLAQTSLSDEYGRRTQAETIVASLRTRLARFSKERSLGTMATAISHEINQPLIAIQNYAQAAKRRLQGSVDDKPKLIELFEKIERQAERAGAITQRVRSLVNRSDLQLQPVPLRPLIEEVIRLMEPEFENRRCSITWESPDNAPTVVADSLQVQLVLINLLQNAIQSICSGDQYDKHVSLDVHPAKDREVQVTVMDRGPGVLPDRVADIFEPLYSSTSGGMGMGLAISRTIIDAHGGRLWYEPNPAGGAIFRFTLRTARS